MQGVVGFSDGSALQLFLGELMAPCHSGHIPDTVARYYAPNKYREGGTFRPCECEFKAERTLVFDSPTVLDPGVISG